MSSFLSSSDVAHRGPGKNVSAIEHLGILSSWYRSFPQSEEYEDGADGEHQALQGQLRGSPIHVVETYPQHLFKRRLVRCDGMAAEIVQATTRERIEFRFHAPFHLLVIYEEGIRQDGETFVEGLSPSRLRDMRRKLTFVPAGREYHEWQEPRVPARMAFFYFDPAQMPKHADASVAAASLEPRLFFEDAALWNSALKLKSQVESTTAEGESYFEALANVVAHEVTRLNAGTCRTEALARGGLAPWQQRTVIAYIEEHLAEPISLATLARLVRLSPYYFCRAFKESFGLPPHRYHNRRRIEHAKVLLAKPERSVTEIGFALGFCETSSFSAAFHKASGLTPTAYRRSLV